MKTLFTTCILVLTTLTLTAQVTIDLKDFEILNNTSWKGSLTYKDYTSGEQYTIPSKLQIIIKNDRIKSSIQYDYEPKKNHTNTIKIKKNGAYYGNEKIIKNSIENEKSIVITSYKGKDNGKKATFFNIHQFDNEHYIITKEVQIENTAERFVRNIYSFTKL